MNLEIFDGNQRQISDLLRMMHEAVFDRYVIMKKGRYVRRKGVIRATRWCSETGRVEFQVFILAKDGYTQSRGPAGASPFIQDSKARAFHPSDDFEFVS